MKFSNNFATLRSKLQGRSSGLGLRLFVSVISMAMLLLMAAGPTSIAAQAASATSTQPNNTTQPHDSALNLPFPHLAAPYVNAGEYPSGDIYVGCCTPSGGSRNLDPMLVYPIIDVGANADTNGSPNLNEADFNYIRSKNPNAIMLMYIDDREISIHDTEYSNLPSSYFLHNTSGQQIYFDSGHTLAMWDLTNSAVVQYLENRVSTRLQEAPTTDGFYVDGNDPDLTVLIQLNPEWGTININETTYHNNENTFLQYLSGIARDGVHNNSHVTHAVVLANASAGWDNYNGSNVINGSLNTNSVNYVETGTYSYNNVLNSYLQDVSSSRTPNITTMTVDGSPTWNNLSTPVNENDPNATGQSNYRRLRFGLTTALMGDGFFQYNQDALHPGVNPDASSTWWYDEYSDGHPLNTSNPPATQGLGYLGNALGAAYRANITAGASGDQVINDSGFENIAQGNPQWYGFHNSSANATFSADTSVIHGGTTSGRLNVSKADPGFYDYFSAGVAHQANIKLVKGDSYSLSLWLRSDSNRGVVVQLNSSNGSTVFATPDFTNNSHITVPNDGNWHQYVYNFSDTTTNDSTATLLIESGTTAGNLWMDDVTLTDNSSTPAVYERDFQNGTAVVNGTSQTVTVQLPKTYRHINGTYEKDVNNGALAESVTIQPFDGVVLDAAAAPGCTSNCTNYNLPFVANGANSVLGQATTYVTLQNLSNNAANVTIQYYNPNDGSANSKTTLLIPGNGQQIVPAVGQGLGLTGIVSSDQALNVIVAEGYSGGGSAYNVSNATGDTLYDPLALNGDYGGFTTSITLFNAGSSSSNGTISFFDQNGNPVSGANKNFTLAPHSSQSFNQSGSGLDANTAYWAKISGTSGTQLVAQIVEVNPNTHFTAIFNAATQSKLASTVYAPAVFDSAFGGFYTGMSLVNPNSNAANVTINYYNADGSSGGTQSVTIPGNGQAGLFQGGAGGPASGFNGSAKITSSQPIVTTINEINATGSFIQSGTYVGLTSGNQNIGLPVMSNGQYGYITGTTILNVSSSAVRVTFAYLDNNGNSVGTKTYTIQPNASQQLFQGNDGLPSSFFGTAYLTGGNANSLVATTNAVNGYASLFYTYTSPSN